MAAPNDHRSLDVCLVALHALPVIRPSADQGVGGTETRAWMFARGLAAIDNTCVRCIVRGPSGMAEFTEAGVQVIPRYDRLYALYEAVGHCVQKRAGFPWLRLRQFRPQLLWQLPMLSLLRVLDRSRRDPLAPDPFFQQIDADVFCTFGVQANSACVIASAHAAGKPAVLIIGSDGDLDARYTPTSDYVSPYGDVAPVCHWMLQQAHAIVTQTPRQQRLLQERFGRTGHIVANPIDLADWHEQVSAPLPAELPAGLDRYALWIGRAEPLHKRPQLLLEVARRCPEIAFVMVLNPRDPRTECEIRRSHPQNVRILSSVAFDRMPALFARAAVFVSTSALEGFPNVFLQAAASGVPIASLEVGDEFLRDSGAGACAGGDLDALCRQIRHCWESPAPAGTNTETSSYLRAHHDLQQQAARLRDVLAGVQIRN